MLAKVCVVNLVSFFQRNIYRCAKRWVWIGNLVAGLVRGIALLYAPMVNGSQMTYHIGYAHYCHWLGNTDTFQTELRIEITILLEQFMFTLYVLLEVVVIIRCDSLNIEVEILNAIYLPLVSLIPLQLFEGRLIDVVRVLCHLMLIEVLLKAINEGWSRTLLFNIREHTAVYNLSYPNRISRFGIVLIC